MDKMIRVVSFQSTIHYVSNVDRIDTYCILGDKDTLCRDVIWIYRNISICFHAANASLSERKIAKSHGVTEVTVRSWANGSRRHPFIKEAIEMTERLTSGKVSRYDLRPDIFGDCPD